MFTGAARAEGPEREPAAIVEAGAAGERGVKGGSSYGPSLAVETTPIEHWLEIEVGTAPLFSPGRTEFDTDLLLKKPWTLSRNAEFMLGVGPSWSRTITHGRSRDSFGAEVAGDFMFWPWRGRKLGWFIEPSIGRSFGAGHDVAASVGVGLLIPVD